MLSLTATQDTTAQSTPEWNYLRSREQTLPATRTQIVEDLPSSCNAATVSSQLARTMPRAQPAQLV